jgi:hypothetical protein
MGDYKGPDNIYWLFISSAQAIAAFIGFLAAGFFFSYDRMDKAVEKDETLEEIYVDIRKQYFRKLSRLLVFTGLSITMSLGVVYLNGYDLGIWSVIIRIGIAVLNLITIAWAIQFVIFIIDPTKVDRTAKKLIKENEQLFNTSSINILTRAQFIGKFINLETVTRDLGEKYRMNIGEVRGGIRFAPLGELIRGLARLGVITKIQETQLLEVSKVRNLAVHGQLNEVEGKLGDLVDDLTFQLQGRLSD